MKEIEKLAKEFTNKAPILKWGEDDQHRREKLEAYSIGFEAGFRKAREMAAAAAGPYGGAEVGLVIQHLGESEVE
jgi:hypothetical protein